jgi:hypothetical protein
MTICTEDDTQAEERENPQATPSPIPPDTAREILKLSTAAVRRILGEHNESIASDTYTSAISSWAKYDPSRPLSTWIYHIANCRVLDARRAAGRPKAMVMDELPQDAADLQQSEGTLSRAEMIRERVRKMIPEDKRRPGQWGLGDRGKLAIMMFAATKPNWTANKIRKTLVDDFTLCQALGIAKPPSSRAVYEAVSFAKLAGFFRKLLG